MKNKKILEICNFSSGVSGVWTRVFEESKRLSKKNDVFVFSSDIENERINPIKNEKISGVNIRRFSVKRRIGYALFFDFEKEALALQPDIIICHGYRKPYLNKAIKIARKLNIPIFLVTHAPFVEYKLRKWKTNIIILLYDLIYGRKILNSFNKVKAITKWEMPYLLNLGLKRENIVYIPNGIPEEFFRIQKAKAQNKILFFGRVNPIKDIETLLRAIAIIKNKEIKLEIVGPGDIEYLNRLKILVNKLGLKNKVIFSDAIYDIKEKIKKIDSCTLFVLPSKREAMPISLIEAMAREKIVISSKTQGGKEIINDEKNGFLFEIGNEKALAEKIDYSLNVNVNRIKKNARLSVKKYSWDKIIKEIERIIS